MLIGIALLATKSNLLEKEKSKLNLKAVIADDIPQSGICVHKSVEHQIYTLICDSKSAGILAKVL